VLERFKHIITFLIIWILLSATGLQGQVWRYPTDPDSFAFVFLEQIRHSGLKHAKEVEYIFRRDWAMPSIEPHERAAFIQRIHYMHSRTFHITDQIELALTFLAQQNRDNLGSEISTDDFFQVVDTMFATLRLHQVIDFLRYLRFVLPKMWGYNNDNFSWSFSQYNPRLVYQQFADVATGDSILIPALIFDNTELVFQSGKDTLQVYSAFSEAKGFLNLWDQTFHLISGKYSWGRLGDEYKEIYCDIQNLKLKLNEPSFKSYQSALHAPRYLGSRALAGVLEERISYVKKPELSAFPYFRGVEDSVVISDLIENAVYEGGFALKGIQPYGIRIRDHAATLHISRIGQKDETLRLEADEIELRPDKIQTERTAATVFLPGGDSLWHPSVNVRYEVILQKLRLQEHRKDPNSWQAFRSTYHQANLGFESLDWDMYSDSMYLGAIVDADNKIAYIESFDHFKQERFDRMSLLLTFNPLAGLFQYFDKMRRIDPSFVTDTFHYLPIIAEALNVPQTYLPRWHSALITLAGSGYVKYISGLMLVRPLGPAYRWVAAARNEKDYDALLFTLRTPKKNFGILSYGSKQLLLSGVEFINLSDSQDVHIQPAGPIQMGANRELTFGGQVTAGKITVFDSKPGFNFKYDEFKVTTDTLDSLKFYPNREFEPNKEFNAELARSLSRLKIENLVGAIYADKPNNKSSKKSSKEYSVFDSYNQSYKYWHDSSDQRKVWIDSTWHTFTYPKDSVRFILDPFLIDSLENFDNRTLEFKGALITGIFPNFEDTLKAVSDNSYGVRELLPEGGVPIYGGKARFHQIVEIDESGLHGNGKLEWSGMLAESDSFYFTFDSVLAKVHTFQMSAGGKSGSAPFPNMKAESLYVRWYPKIDKLVIETIKEPITIFQDAKFEGRLELSPEGVKGSGTINVGGLKLTDTAFVFGKEKMEFSNADFVVTEPKNPLKPLFIAQKVKGDFLLTEAAKGSCTFESVNPDSTDFMFVNQKYKATFGKGVFNRETGELTLTSHSLAHTRYDPDTRQRIPDSTKAGQFDYLYSIAPQLHDIWFGAEIITYALKNHTITAVGVDSILIADAKIFPKDRTLTIPESGIPDSLFDARIRITNDGRHHELIDATVKINSGISYNAKANYQYRKFGNKEQKIPFDPIIVRKEDEQTYAAAKITEDQMFWITEKVQFMGKVELLGSQEFMKFSGKVRINSKNPVFKDPKIFGWMPFNEENVNPDTIYIPIKDKDVDGTNAQQTTLGLFHVLSKQRIHQLYHSFLQKKWSGLENSEPILTTAGGLTYDAKAGEFRIGPKGKILEKQLRGNVVSFNDETNSYQSQGVFQLPRYEMPPEHIRLYTAGRFKGQNDPVKGTKNGVCDLLIGVHFPKIDDTAFNYLAKRLILETASEAVPTIDFSGFGTLPDENVKLLQDLLAEILDYNTKVEDVFALVDKKSANYKADLFAAARRNEPNATKLIHDQAAELFSKGIPLNNVFAIRDHLRPAEAVHKSVKTHLLLMAKFKYFQTGKITTLYCDAMGEGEDAPRIAVIGINGKTVAKKFRGMIEYKMEQVSGDERKPDMLRIYLELDEHYWLYVEFSDGNKIAVIPSEQLPTAREIIAKLRRKNKKDDTNKKHQIIMGLSDEAIEDMKNHFDKYYRKNP
jgi:hypothetical protein